MKRLRMRILLLMEDGADQSEVREILAKQEKRPLTEKEKQKIREIYSEFQA